MIGQGLAPAPGDVVAVAPVGNDSLPPLRDTVLNTLDLWCCTSDAGPDVSAARRQAETEVGDDPARWFIHSDCLLHQRLSLI